MGNPDDGETTRPWRGAPPGKRPPVRRVRADVDPRLAGQDRTVVAPTGPRRESEPTRAAPTSRDERTLPAARPNAARAAQPGGRRAPGSGGTPAPGLAAGAPRSPHHPPPVGPHYPPGPRPVARPPAVTPPPDAHLRQPSPYPARPGVEGSPPRGAPSGASRGPRGRPRALLWGALGVLAATVLAAGVFIGLSTPSAWFGGKELDIGNAQAEVQRVLTDDITGYGDAGVADVTCNGGHNAAVRVGASFTCQVTVDGTPRQVTVTFLDDNGNFEVGRPT